MRLDHECKIPDQEVPFNVSQIKKGWTCFMCGERWEIIYRRTGYSASRQRPVMRIIRHWRWSHGVKRDMREAGVL